MTGYNLHNSTYTILSPSPINNLPEGFVPYIGDFKSSLVTIQKKELISNKLHLGHFIIYKPEEFSYNLNTLIRLNLLTPKNLFVESVKHTGVDKECTIDTNIIFCSSWVLPIILNTYRTVNTLYGNCMARRLKINKLQTHSLV